MTPGNNDMKVFTYPDSGELQGVGNALTAGLRAGLMAERKTQFCQHSLHIVNK